jgi:hypothetical protein
VKRKKKNTPSTPRKKENGKKDKRSLKEQLDDPKFVKDLEVGLGALYDMTHPNGHR